SVMVERMGVKVADIPIALISHLHYGHWAGHRLFPASEFWIQKDEVAFWTGPFARYDAFSQSQNVGALTNLVPLNYSGRIKIIEGEREVLPGLRVHRVGGHTAGLQIVSVETARGRVVLTSDAAHFYRNVERLALADQEAAGIDVVTDGEQSRQHFVHGFLDRLEGIDFGKRVTIGIRADRYKAEVPTVTGPIARRTPVHVDEVRWARAHTTRRLKFTIP